MSGSPGGILEFASGILGMESSEKAAETAANASLASQAASNNMLLQMYNQNRSDQLPLIQAGQKAINQLSSLTGEGGKLYDTGKYTTAAYQEDPYYTWLRNMGTKSIQAKSAAMGNIGSGNMGTALVDYSQNLAMQGFQDWWNRGQAEDTTLYNRLMGIVSPSQTAAANVGGAGMSTASGIASNNLASTNAINNANMTGSMLSNQFLSQGIAGLGSANSQIGNAIMQALQTYGNNNAYYNYNQAAGGYDQYYGGYGGWSDYVPTDYSFLGGM